MGLPEGEKVQYIESVKVAVISATTCSVHRHWVAEEDMVGPPLGRSPVDLFAEDLFHGGYFLLGINLNWKDLATLSFHKPLPLICLSTVSPRMLFPCL